MNGHNTTLLTCKYCGTCGLAKGYSLDLFCSTMFCYMYVLNGANDKRLITFSHESLLFDHPLCLRRPRNYATGGAAGVVESFCCHPLDTIKTRTQLTSLSPAIVAKRLVKNEGVFAL